MPEFSTTRTARLDQLATVERGRSRHRPRNAPHLFGGPYPFVQTGEVKAAEFWIHNYEQTYSEAGLEQSRLWPAGTICVTIAANIAESGVLATDACFPDSVVGVTPHEGTADMSFLKYALDFMKLRLQAVSGGTTQDNLSLEKLLSFEFPAPPIDSQRRIARALRVFDDLIENNRRRIEILEEMARLLYREWFVHFRFPGHEDVDLCDSDLGLIPEDWEALQVSDALGVVGGGTPSKGVEEYWAEGSVQWFTPTDLTRAGSAFAFDSGTRITELGLKKSSARLFPPGSVMMTSRATIGVISISVSEAATNQGFITCVPTDGLPSSYIYFWLHENVHQFLSLSGGATFKELRKSTFRELPILVPCRSAMQQFEKRVGPKMDLIKNLLQQNKILREARDLLLPRLVSGELDVSELDLGLEALGA